VIPLPSAPCLLIYLAALVAALMLPASTVLAAPTMISGDGKRLLAPNGAPFFLLALNYQGPSDRAWEMWNDDKFDIGLVEADFQRAASAGVHALRIFIQAGLARDLATGRWDKLDQVVALAERRNLQLILAMHDYPEVDLVKVAGTMGQIAQRYQGRPGILAYDLRNEPRFGDLALAHYPAPVPLQQAELIKIYGERLARADLAAYRESEEGAKTVPAALSDDQAWTYVNNLRLYREFLAEASEWVRGRGYQGTSLDYMDDPAAEKWRPLIGALDATLRAWIQPQVEALHRADPARPVTVGHVDGILAKLPANDLLDFHTLHRYPGPGAGPLRSTLSLLGSLRKAHPGRPYVLGEFGYANDTLEPDKTALLETATYLGLVSQEIAGGAKWMLNDMPPGYNARERTMGAYTRDGAPKPLVAALAALRRYLGTTGSAPGDLVLEDDPDAGLRYVYRAADALLLGGKQVDGDAAQFTAEGPAQLFLTWSEPGIVRVWASAPMQVEARLDSLVGRTSPADVRLVRLDGDQEAAVPLADRDGPSVHLALDQAGNYVLRVGPTTARAAEYDIPQGHFFTQTNGRGDGPSAAGFSVTNADGIPFWDAFQDLGGVEVLGYPVSRRFQRDGLMVQAFQKAVLQWRPDRDGQVWFLNTFDVLHDQGKDDWLEVYRQTPRPADTAPDTGLAWERVVARHLAFLNRVPAPLRERFLEDPLWLEHYGLPVATKEYPQSVVVRAQRATFQYWKETTPWAQKGDVTVANGGDLAKEAGVWPWLAVTPENAPR
jgi:hypothetical protein